MFDSTLFCSKVRKRWRDWNEKEVRKNTCEAVLPGRVVQSTQIFIWVL